MNNDLSRKQTEITAMRNHHALLCNRLSEVRNALDALETKKKALQLQSEEAAEKVFQLCKELEVIKNKHNIEVGCTVRCVDGSYSVALDTEAGTTAYRLTACPGTETCISRGKVVAINCKLPSESISSYNPPPNNCIVQHGKYITFTQVDFLERIS